MQNTLDFVGDGDQVDAVWEVEETFGIKLSDEELEPIQTVGQLHDLIELKRPNAGSRTLACLSQVAFYRLRRALEAMGIEGEIVRQTPISVLDRIPSRSISQKWRRLAERSGLNLPPLETSSWLWLSERLPRNSKWLRRLASGMFLCGWAFAILRAGQAAILAVPALIILADYIWRLAFRSVPRRLLTVGELAREAAGSSFAKLAAEKNASSPSDRWFALTAVLRGMTGHKTAITRQTTLFAVHAS
jgi:hypothetical protein